MAHVGVVSAAFYGDVLPFVPIADELAARGHEVSVVVPNGFHDVLRGHAFELVHLGTDFSPRELADHGDIMERGQSIRGMRAATDLWVKQLTIDPAPAILDVLDTVAPDVWLVHPSLTWLVELQATPTGTPVTVGHLFPMMIPSGQQPPPMLSGRGHRMLNAVGWRMTRTLTGRMMYDDQINRLRTDRDLPPATAHVAFAWERADRTLMLSSGTYWPRPGDWADRVVMTGFTVWGAPDDRLPDDLRDYLQRGAPPVLVTLGTSAATNARDAFTMAADAIESSGHRPLLLVGNDRNRQLLAGRHDVWTFASLPAVLPHCHTIVHAGGHGTTAAALHAGTPQVAMPQGFDQSPHARRIEDLGIGVDLPWKRRSTDRLKRTLVAAADDAIRENAERLAQRLAMEDGPGAAADEIEAVALLEGA